MTDKNQFGETLNLPQTNFPMRAGLPTAEPLWVKKWLDEDLYGQLRQKRAGAQKFILHCGPPYANGHFHAGHLVPCSLKDMIVRSKSMRGFDAGFVPGWDCHGLPIEWKVEAALREEGKNKEDITRRELRAKCRATAEKWVGVQKEEWQRLGVMGDWDNPYLTMNFKNEAGIIRELGRMAKNGHIFKGLRPVMWSPVEETALAEAEVEYDDHHKSTAVYVKYPVVGRKNEFVVIWTTTPWTLPASKAVAYGEEMDYTPLQAGEEIYYVAKALQENFIEACGLENVTAGNGVAGETFKGWQVAHPFYGTGLPMLAAEHVTTEAGTGFVHTAPAHGVEDFAVGKAAGLDVNCPVDGRGHYVATVPALPATGVEIAGKYYEGAQKKIVAEMEANGNLLKAYTLTHSYPISWRSKKPLIYRTTSQWYVDLDGQQGNANIRQKALDVIHGQNGEKGVRWVPAYGENRLGAMVKNRGDWCLSRQRAWGVPITILENKNTGEFYADLEIFDHVANLVEEQGIDVWDEAPIEDLVPEGWLEEKGLKAEDLTKVTDILDVWFDSGSSYAHVMDGDARFARNDGKRMADLYLEGSDQHRGWFQSSLLTSIAARGDAPYEQVLTHGFVVDGNGKKMSKSIGNGMDAMELGQKYGMDIARLWIASSDYTEDIRLSDEIIKGVADAYRRFRNTYRFLLGNLHGFSKENLVPYETLPELEQYILHRLGTITNAVQEDYDAYQFHKVYQAFYTFCSVELSGFYFDVRKDVLYCDAENAARRRATQTVLQHVFDALVTYMAPIIPFTTEEVWQTRQEALNADQESVHLQCFASPPSAWINPDLEEKWTQVMAVRHTVNKAVEEQRAAGVVGSNVEVKVTLPVAKNLENINWQDVLIVSEVVLKQSGDVEVEKSALSKCPRCWQHRADVGSNSAHPGVCGRCAEALEANPKTAVA